MDDAGGELLQRRRLRLDAADLGIPGVFQLGRLRYQEASRPLDEHLHAGLLEICCLARGRQTYALGSRRYDLRGGDLFVTPPSLSHSTGGAPEEKSVLFWLLLTVPPAPEFLHLPPNEARELADDLLALPRQFPGPPRLYRLLDEIFLLHARRPKHWQTAARLRLVDFLLQAVEAGCTAGGRGRTSPGVAAALAYVAEALEEDIAVGNLAKAARMSESHFKRVFQGEIGLPPREYVLREKVTRAQQMLADPARSVTDVAFALGFRSSAYFSTVFRRFTGKTPSAWREESSSGG